MSWSPTKYYLAEVRKLLKPAKGHKESKADSTRRRQDAERYLKYAEDRLTQLESFGIDP